MPGRKKKTLVLEDPRALRALAHPARQKLIEELYAGRVLTATEAADMVDLTPSAVSHHLRALEKWGIARRAIGSRDGRERPWESTAQSITLRGTGGAGSAAALTSVVRLKLAELGERLDAFIDGGPDPWESAYRGMITGDVWLTEEETRRINETVAGLVDEFEGARAPGKRPPGARRATFAWMMVPLEPPTDQPNRDR